MWRLDGWAGDGGRLGDAEREIYEETLRNSAARLAPMVRSGDVIFCHDPQTAGLVAPVAAFGATVVWRCHVGLDLPNELAWGAWDFLRPYVEPADAYVFSRREFAWEDLAEEKLWVVATSIDAFSPKNQDLDPTVVDAILARVGLATESDGSAGLPALRWVARTGRRQRRSTKAAPIPADGADDRPDLALGPPQGPSRRHARLCREPPRRPGPPSPRGAERRRGLR